LRGAEPVKGLSSCCNPRRGAKWFPTLFVEPCPFLVTRIVGIIFAVPLYRTSLPSSYTLLHYSAVWSERCDAYSTVAVPTGWWWGSSQLHHHCQSRPYWSHHLFNQCPIVSCTLQCHQHYQHSGY